LTASPSMRTRARGSGSPVAAFFTTPWTTVRTALARGAEVEGASGLTEGGGGSAWTCGHSLGLCASNPTAPIHTVNKKKRPTRGRIVPVPASLAALPRLFQGATVYCDGSGPGKGIAPAQQMSHQNSRFRPRWRINPAPGTREY
jgi:hypothetical protein